MSSSDEEIVEYDDEPKGWSVARLTKLSNLGPDELKAFREYWHTIDVKKRRQITQQFADLSDESLELNFDDIFRFLLEDPDEEVRVKAVEGLWECEDRTLVNPFVKLLANDPSEQVRASSATALGRFALMVEFNELRPKDAAKVEEALFRVIDDPASPLEVRRRAIETVSPISSERVSQIILDAYQSDNPKLKISAVFAMGRSCNEKWLPTIISELSSDDAEMRFEAANACGEMEDQRAVTHLLPLIDDSDFLVQVAAVNALGHIGGALARRALNRCLKHPDERVREAAEDAIEEMSLIDDPLGFSF